MHSHHKKNQIVVITGATAGLGRAITREFAKQGAKIALLARDKERLEITKKEIESMGGQALAIPTDVADSNQVEEAAALVENEWGTIDIWINNAMISVFSPTIEITPNEFKRVTEVNYLGYVYGTLSALKRMIPKNQGMIIQIGSALAYRGIPLQSPYCAAKHAVEGFTESVRCELLHDKSNVKITMIQLPAMNTPHFGWVKNRLPRKPQPVPPIFQPEVAAEAVLWASQHYRREWYVGLPTVIAIIGNKIVPGVGDWYLARTCYKDQQYDGPSDPHQPNNIFHPVPGNFEAHGNFDSRSSSTSIQFWLDKYRNWIWLGLLAAVILALISYVR